MADKLILTLSVIGILILGAIVTCVAISFSGGCDFLNIREHRGEGIEKSDNLIYISIYEKSPCNSVEGSLCFITQEVEQTRAESFNYPKTKQIRAEPCPKPKQICPLCRDEVEQIRGDGYVEEVEQIKTNC
ncbi:MAG: hypothetical protein WCX73_02855 [Candidatus Pacearchaeota archaeon]|jgi:hypothetical protein